MDQISLPTPLQPGLVNFPGATLSSTTLVQQLLLKDASEHHCFWNGQYFTNHLAHHILSLHDLGVSETLIQAMYDKEAAIQRPIYVEGSPLTEDKRVMTATNWTQRLGNDNVHMYSSYLTFFTGEVAKLGVAGAFERYLFSPEANANGTLMLARFMSRLLHPMIQAGFGIEFGQDFMVAQGLAQAAVCFPDAANMMDAPTNTPTIKSGLERPLLSFLREVYDCPALAPLPYEGPSTDAERFVEWMVMDPSRDAALRSIYAEWTFDLTLTGAESDTYFARKVDECLWQAALLLGATSRAGRKPRMDFFLMHFLTGALFLPSMVKKLKEPMQRAQVLQAYARMAGLFVVLRGRPRIDGRVVMGYSAPSERSASPWLDLLENAAAHPEAHVVKAIRMLFYCANRFGPAARKTHPGLVDADGTLFVRIASALMDALGWVGRGEEDRFWDVSGIGWEEAWVEDDEVATAT
ncbi:hypothetical protein C8F01DRAFT_1136024 [Mycena amicta]|nr:hypothetical protein C8F01DRAFT_1136024 [Mycena amicta]